MKELVQYLSELDPVLAAFYATTFTWFLTMMGASLVFFFKQMNRALLDGLLGFTGGVMVAASCFGLLLPAIDQAAEMGMKDGWEVMPATVGFALGALFLFILNKLLPHLHINFREDEKEGPKTSWHSTTLLVLAITLHNIPEGLAVGVLFGAAGGDIEMISSAVIITIGIGIQNFPEGIAVAMPLRRQGVSRGKSFWYGQLSAIVEPIAGVAGAWAVASFVPILPYALGFAAGAMIFVVVEEVIPETQRDKYRDIGVLGFIGGFLLMMVLDVVLG
ncbi:MAG: ZIP family metal transporter [Crocinitomicaceae bacterium]|nr:ZIP family metal transporter [Crocinitomicaceae bacterium]MDG2441448.1 ZIP family metal transporter [Crocinitomicaceae bacterium]|tara:strand:+ start:3848 stop:4672 length:825 start_codon:yes stop_codon:yes gene_type:complete